LCSNIKPINIHAVDARKKSIYGRKGRDDLHGISKVSLAVTNDVLDFKFGICDVGSHSLALLYLPMISLFDNIIVLLSFVC